jgi:Hint module
VFNSTATTTANTTRTTTKNLTTTTNLTETTLPIESPAANKSKKSCFPSSATVELRDGSVVRMDDLSIGDDVKVGPNTFSKVFMFTHRVSGIFTVFLEISTSSGASIALTGGHYIHADGALIPASKLRVGSAVRLGTGQVDHVLSVRTVHRTGLYNPQTLQGEVVVNGVLASTYTTAIEPELAHVVLLPFRSLFKSRHLATSLFESGGGFAASFLEYIPLLG